MLEHTVINLQKAGPFFKDLTDIRQNVTAHLSKRGEDNNRRGKEREKEKFSV